MANAVAQLDDPLSATLIFDDTIWNGEPGHKGPVAVNPILPDAGGKIATADDLKGLADITGVAANVLEETVARYNEAVTAGKAGALEPPRTTRAHKAYPIATPPFRAVPLASGITGTMGGLSIDAHARVLKADGMPIPGLYAAGTSTGGLEGGPRVTYMGGLAKAFIFGLLAAEHMAGCVTG
jgi:fumarate reductase flavoprotein subunit